MEQKKLEEAHKIATSSNPLLKGSTYGDKAMEYVGTIIECIEKQIPKKPKIVAFNIDGRKEIGYCCVSCMKDSKHAAPLIVLDNYKAKYCYYCGQAIDWSEGKGK